MAWSTKDTTITVTTQITIYLRKQGTEMHQSCFSFTLDGVSSCHIEFVGLLIVVETGS